MIGMFKWETHIQRLPAANFQNFEEWTALLSEQRLYKFYFYVFKLHLPCFRPPSLWRSYLDETIKCNCTISNDSDLSLELGSSKYILQSRTMLINLLWCNGTGLTQTLKLSERNPGPCLPNIFSYLCVKAVGKMLSNRIHDLLYHCY